MKMPLRIVLGGLIGAGAGLLIGYLTSHLGSSCVFFCVPWRGAAVGAIAGMIIAATK